MYRELAFSLFGVPLFSVVVLFFALLITDVPQDFNLVENGARPKNNNNAETQKANLASPKLAYGTKVEVDKKFLALHEGFNERVKLGKIDLLFLGDSITERWKTDGKEIWENRYEKRNAVNFGIGGDQTQHLLWRLQNGNLDGPINPKAVVVMIGTNNLDFFSAEQTAAGIKEVVHQVKLKLPSTKILLMGILPYWQDPQDKKTKAARERVVNTNQIISKFADGQSVSYFDIGEKLIEKDGKIDKKTMHDFVHLTPKGYLIWADAIEKALSAVMN